MPESRLTHVTNVIIAVCAVALTGRLVFGWGTDPTTQVGTKVKVENWSDVLAGGHMEGRPEAVVQLVVFEDFECPICGEFARRSLPGVLAGHPEQVAATFRHYPLQYHRAAYSAAIGAECAADQGHFMKYRSHVFDHQEELDSTAILQLGLSAGVPDSTEFAECLGRARPHPAIESEMELGRAIGVSGTPAIAVNGYLMRISPDSTSFSRFVDSMVATLD